MEKVKLSNRLESIVGMVTPKSRVCDVGCDHAFTDIALVQRGIAVKALAMDVKEGPLERAKEHIAEYGLEDLIVTRLSNGLKKYSIGEADSLIISGMGGPLMQSILSENWNNTRDFKEMIFSPQSEIYEFRCFLKKNGIEIIDEDMVKEDGKYYTIIKCKFKKNSSMKKLLSAEDMCEGAADASCTEAESAGNALCTEAEAAGNASCTEAEATGNASCTETEAAGNTARENLSFGPKLIEKRSQVLRMFLSEDKRKKEAILNRLIATAENSAKNLKRIGELTDEINMIKNVLARMGEG